MSGRKPLSATSFPVGLYAALPASPALSEPGSGRFFGTAVVVVWGDFAWGLLPLLHPAARKIATSAHASARRQRSCMGRDRTVRAGRRGGRHGDPPTRTACRGPTTA